MKLFVIIRQLDARARLIVYAFALVFFQQIAFPASVTLDVRITNNFPATIIKYSIYYRATTLDAWTRCNANEFLNANADAAKHQIGVAVGGQFKIHWSECCPSLVLSCCPEPTETSNSAYIHSENSTEDGLAIWTIPSSGDPHFTIIPSVFMETVDAAAVEAVSPTNLGIFRVHRRGNPSAVTLSLDASGTGTWGSDWSIYTKSCGTYPCGTETLVTTSYSLGAGVRQAEFWVVAIYDGVSNEPVEYAIPFLNSGNGVYRRYPPEWAEISLTNTN